MKIYSPEVPTNWEEYSDMRGNDMTEYFEANRFANEHASRGAGYTGPLTGKMIRMGVADGYANYMVIQKGSTISLVCMDWLDGYQFPYDHRWTRKDVMDMIARHDAMKKLFAVRS